MDLENSERKEIIVHNLKFHHIQKFINLRKKVEQTSEHLVVSSGERRENFFHFLTRLFLNRGRMNVFLAKNSGTPVGYLTVVLPRFRKMRGNAYISLGVLDSHRDRGIGTKLLETAEEFAKSRGLRRVELEVLAKNEGAIKLYKRLGYTEEGRRKKAIKDGEEFDDLVFMVKFI